MGQVGWWQGPISGCRLGGDAEGGKWSAQVFIVVKAVRTLDRLDIDYEGE